jgi:inorganic pyrophosphatase
MKLPPPFISDSDLIYALIETPRNSSAKYAFDPTTGLFKLMKILAPGLAFPLNFGFVPGTQAEDGDPVDVLVLTQQKLEMGSVVECRVIGVIQAEQQDKGKEVQRNDRILAVPLVSHEYDNIQTIDDLGQQWVDELIHFFVDYRARSSSTFTPLGQQGPQLALAWIKQRILEQSNL